MDAKTLLESVKEDLPSFTCLGYFTDPVNINHGHTFCKDCLFNCWEEAHTPKPCPNCKAISEFEDFLYNRRMQNLNVFGKMLTPPFLQSTRNMTTCKKHRKEEILFCEEDHRLLCGPCFFTEEHKDRKVLPLEQATAQCMVEGQTLKDLVLSEYEKMQQFFLEEEESQLQNLDKEAGDTLAAEESKDGQSQENLNLPMNPEQQPVEMLQLEVQPMKQSMKSEFEKKHQFLLEQKQLHLQTLDKERKDNLAKFEESKAKMTQQIHKLQKAISEIEKSFAKLPVEMLLDSKGILERNEELLLQNSVTASPKWTMYPIPGLREKLLTFHRDITLDPETANPHLILSDDLKRVEYVSVPQDVPDKPKRFELTLCVLANQSFTSGKHYWEIEVENTEEWEVGICKETIKRKSFSPRVGLSSQQEELQISSICGCFQIYQHIDVKDKVRGQCSLDFGTQ
ncbi:probable E3 ubiquitin-protein ligase TRIML1 [Petaurus breviceps papuanus]|uniref:probable E3 ubiquitin-protein ligase TRIML1 n=1 Tax=Petaurus breviceps papuanus TaxID=3040969 RepID=UPI0036DEE6DD